MGPEEGTELGPCYPNGMCNEGLVCLSNTCVDPGTVDAGPGVDAEPLVDANAQVDAGATDAAVLDAAAQDAGGTDGGADGGADAGADGGLPCTTGWCDQTCAEVALAGSHFGCDFWPTPTANPYLDAAFDNNFGVIVHNPNTQPALVTVTLGASQMSQVSVPAGQIHTFELPLDTGLKLSSGNEESVLQPNGAYHMTTDRPVTAYQFNPLDFEIGGTNSHSNDAALLLPTHALGTDYMVTARQTFGVDQNGLGFSFLPGFFAVVGTVNNTTVTVDFSAHTVGGTAGGPYTPGQVQAFTLNAGEVLQILSAIPTTCTGTISTDNCNGLGTCEYCDMGANYDLTGTAIQSTQPVALYSGHSCSFVPYNTWACDHLEDQQAPVSTWGDTVVVARTEPQNDTGFPPEPNVVRLVSAVSNNVINFTPTQFFGPSVTLSQGEWVEFESDDDFVASASGPLQVTQFLVGQNAYTSQIPYWGDPAMGRIPPVAQYQTYYAFLAPPTFLYHYVNVVAEVGPGAAPVYLDGQPLAAALFSPDIGGSGYGAARVAIIGGEHVIASTAPFAITVYGFADFTSYLYPGGQGLNPINP